METGVIEGLAKSVAFLLLPFSSAILSFCGMCTTLYCAPASHGRQVGGGGTVER